MRTRNRNSRRISLRGANGFETAVNTLNAVVGATSTTTQVMGTGLTNAVEIGLLAFPESVRKAIASTAKGSGISATIESIKSVEATIAAQDEMYVLKDKLTDALGVTTVDYEELLEEEIYSRHENEDDAEKILKGIFKRINSGKTTAEEEYNRLKGGK